MKSLLVKFEIKQFLRLKLHSEVNYKNSLTGKKGIIKNTRKVSQF